MLDLNTSIWTNISSVALGTPPSPRFHHSFTALNGKLYVFGGSVDSSGLLDYGQSLRAFLIWCLDFFSTVFSILSQSSAMFAEDQLPIRKMWAEVFVKQHLSDIFVWYENIGVTNCVVIHDHTLLSQITGSDLSNILESKHCPVTFVTYSSPLHRLESAWWSIRFRHVSERVDEPHLPDARYAKGKGRCWLHLSGQQPLLARRSFEFHWYVATKHWSLGYVNLF